MATTTALSSSMSQAIELLETLNTLLMVERTALKDRDTANIKSVLEKKTSLLEDLESNATTRSQILTQAGFDGNEQGMTAYLETLPMSASALSAQWQTLKENLHRCKETNEINGTIVSRSKTQVESLLNIMRGQSGQQKIYTDAGKSPSVGGGHSLAKA